MQNYKNKLVFAVELGVVCGLLVQIKLKNSLGSSASGPLWSMNIYYTSEDYRANSTGSVSDDPTLYCLRLQTRGLPEP